ncbi:MAG TPA: tagaturonate epimerase family protein [bacterium]|nr:tagaturonate epimerase family protein [bacterium]HOL34782.1 tagaturonate epimerase family protein [bacterium]HPP07759.1 tagaturonate epimerase family protein [bacterium]
MSYLFKKQYPDFRLFESSLRKHGDDYYFVAEKNGRMYLVIGNNSFRFIEREESPEILRKTFSFLTPVCAGMKNSFGFGDRTGFATPGHIRAVEGSGLFPIFAQQSARELERTGRTFKQVLDDVIFWCFAFGWINGFGADADHAKNFDVLQEAISAGYTFFTIDPSDKIRNPSDIASCKKQSIDKYIKEYSGKNFACNGFSFVFTEEMVSELAITYGQAIDFIEECYLFISDRKKNFDFEVSVDETKVPTTVYAHVFIVMELRRRNIEFNSLALRFSGRFEKGIDYIGDINEFARELEIHNKIRNHLGPYKISLHSGSDKFSIYGAFKKTLGDMFHVKTSGTSWIQAMKTIAAIDREFFMKCLEVALKDFEKNSRSYEISTDISRINLEKIRNENLDEIFSDNHIRQLIHISYGSIIGNAPESQEMKQHYNILIEKNCELYFRFIEEHLKKHVQLLT